MGMDRAIAIAEVELNNGIDEAYVCRGDGSDWALRLWREGRELYKLEVSGPQIPSHIRRMEHMD